MVIYRIKKNTKLFCPIFLFSVFPIKVIGNFQNPNERKGGIDTYCAVPDEEKNLLCLLGPTNDVWEASCFLRGHPVMGKSALKSCTLHTWQRKQRSTRTVQEGTEQR